MPRTSKKRSNVLSRVKSHQAGLWLFLRELIIHPKAVGAAFPSSTKLARAMAKQIPLKTPNTIIELGGGTGVITASLLESGIDAKKLVIVERSSALAKHLRKRFPQLHIINGDARELHRLLMLEHEPVSAIVSGLPLRSLPAATVKSIGQQVDRVLAPNGLFIQFTYGLFSKPLSPSPNFYCAYSHHVWWNLPPARVDVFHKITQEVSLSNPKKMFDLKFKEVVLEEEYS
jgi:phosphatidylethanolamine/phosphatidyl-N-methylethanolamine N-methyltransferase